MGFLIKNMSIVREMTARFLKDSGIWHFIFVVNDHFYHSTTRRGNTTGSADGW